MRDDEPMERDDDDYRPARRRRSRKTPVWVPIAIALGCVGAIVICALAVRAIRPPKDRESVSHDGDSAVERVADDEASERQILAILDEPGSFKGKRLTLRLKIQSAIFGDRGDSLQNYAGRPVQFYAYGPRMEHLDITITMPKDGLPNAQFADTLDVTFTCEQGSLMHGNEGLRVRRP